jgi:glycine betaine/proline transport system substrate-binding protein
MKPSRRQFSQLIASGLCSVGLGSWGCSSSETTTPTPNTGNTTTDKKGNSLIRMVHNDWLSANLNDEVARILLTEQLGYTVEYVPLGTKDQWPSLAKGESHVSLELWPSGHTERITQYIDTEKTVENGGALGPVAKKGFYMPTYTANKYPGIRKWESLKDPTMSAVFKTPDSGLKGRLLSGDPTWTNIHDQLITNLGLNLVTINAGSEELELKEVASSYEKQADVLFYFWTPHWIFNLYDLTAVEFPAYSATCYQKKDAKGIDCDYPSETLTKIMWSDFKNYAPLAYQFLKNMNYETKSQIQMMGTVEISKQSVEQSARKWVDENKTIWTAWLPAV